MRAWLVHEFSAPYPTCFGSTRSTHPSRDRAKSRSPSRRSQDIFNDIDGIRGRYRTVPVQPPYIPGMAGSRRRRAAGDGGGALVGRRVCAIPAGAFGGYAEVAVAPVVMTFVMPEDMDTATAASLYMPFHLASLAFTNEPASGVDDTVLVHAAAGGADRPPYNSPATGGPE